MAQPAGAVQVEMSVSDGTTTICEGFVDGVGQCDLGALPVSIVTVTWQLDAPAVLNGYDFQVQWDPTELELVSTAQLYPESQPPGTVPFLVEPDPLDPAGSAAVALSLVTFQTTSLFSLTFELTNPIRCGADLTWSANGNGLAPASVVLDNPDGGAIDFSVPAECSDGLDNEGDGKIDFDGGVCAGLAGPQITEPDPHCTDARDNRERRTSSSCGLGAELAALLPLIGALRAARRRRAR